MAPVKVSSRAEYESEDDDAEDEDDEDEDEDESYYDQFDMDLSSLYVSKF